ncbi:MAG: hypothetical protein AABY14_02780, partial [Nanoarchaeota archaeon]
LRQKILDNCKTGFFSKADMIIIEFLFKKHLIQPKKGLENSDFADIQHIAYSPYMDYFITDKNNVDILKQIKKSTDLLNRTTMIKSKTEFKTFLSNYKYIKPT